MFCKTFCKVAFRLNHFVFHSQSLLLPVGGTLPLDWLRDLKVSRRVLISTAIERLLSRNESHGFNIQECTVQELFSGAVLYDCKYIRKYSTTK